MPIRQDDERMREAIRLVEARAKQVRREWDEAEDDEPGFWGVVGLVFGALLVGAVVGLAAVWPW